MEKRLTSKLVGIIIISILILGNTTVLGTAISIAHTIADKEVVTKSTEKLVIEGINYETPIIDEIPGIYIGDLSINLMPIDLTLTKSDVPKLIERLNDSEYEAVYLDNEVYLRVTSHGIIQISENNGSTWIEYDTDSVNSQDFAIWILKNDPIPGYSMKEMQTRLENGAIVRHLRVNEKKEMYFIIDDTGVQIELVQHEKVASILIDNERMMLTFVQSNPFIVSEKMLQSFYNLLVFCDILTTSEADQDCEERLIWIEGNINFTIN